MRRRYWWQNKLPNLVIESYQLKSAEIQKRIFIRCLLGRFLVKSCWYRGERIPRNQYFYIFNKEGGQLLQFEEAPQFGKMPISTHATKKLATYQQATKVDLLEKDKKSFFKIIKIKQLRSRK